jgi:DivIVA domain-containing protein
MELTPQTLHAVEFREARRGGYNTRDVDDFLERVAAGVGHLHERLRELAIRAEAAEGRLLETQRQLEEAQRRQAPGAAPASMSTMSEADDTLRRTLVLAQRTADATIKEAKQEANRLLDEARAEAARTRGVAEADARRGADSARLTVEAEIEALMGQRDALSADIEALNRHIDDQREHILAGVEHLRRTVDEAALAPLPVPPLAEVERRAPAPGPSPAAGFTPLHGMGPGPAPGPGATAEAPNGSVGGAGPPFPPGARVAALQEPPPPARPPEAGPPAQPMPFTAPGDAHGPWLPSELRTSLGEEREAGPTPPPAGPFAVEGPGGANGTEGVPDDSRPSEWGRAVFDPESSETDRSTSG